MTDTSHIRSYREQAGLTQADLGRRIGGVSRSTVCKWESGERLPSARFWPALTREIGIPLCKLSPFIAEATRGQ